MSFDVTTGSQGRYCYVPCLVVVAADAAVVDAWIL
jgi:hypothetical protein